MPSQVRARSNLVFKGIHYLDLIAYKITKGAKLEGLEIRLEKRVTEASISTSFADGMTHVTDQLIYENDLLVRWEMKFKQHDRTYLVFDRKEFDGLRNRR
ncbi:hypothetical protein [Mechercharimyces sp. CAU 1602]|uniref:hypothetical protein n=1 Tax=Mechercharimyces sp. CAU 1602 TaxID=2973933 RepID=UPI002163A44C|nr:hypothetical protein [Mechercharimyces sp. CAU 1602]MCS1350280.1 hypothetical protein [Mechercharimyces sp. CAU 1602]